ncbi:MAG TPA: hypothetical protein VG710_03075 [Opitutus sp.]|nr:hypothetical protein [Opitutus sp.]
MKGLRLFLLAGLAGIAACDVRASSVRPPQFTELVRRADSVVRGEVTAVRSEWRGSGATHRIVTLVTVRVDESIVGARQSAMELEFLGGRVGDETLTVTDQPQFSVGDRDILFVAGNHRQFCPLVAMMYGRYPIVRDPADAGRELVARENGAALRSVDDIAQPLTAAAAANQTRSAQSLATGPMTVAAFEASIRQAAAALGRKDRAP